MHAPCNRVLSYIKKKLVLIFGPGVLQEIYTVADAREALQGGSKASKADSDKWRIERHEFCWDW
jgi:hypothetical protein